MRFWLLSSVLVVATPFIQVEAQGGVQSLFASDATTESIYRFEDLDQSGDFKQVGEISAYYDDAVSAADLVGKPEFAFNANGELFAFDDSFPGLYVMRDINGDGDVNDASEVSVFFDVNNAVGIVPTEVRAFEVDDQGVLWVSLTDLVNPQGDLVILRLEDLDGDGDANDAAESRVYLIVGPAGAPSADFVGDVRIGLDGALYYTRNQNVGKGIFRAEDIDGNGTIEPLTELIQFTSIGTNSTELRGLVQDGQGFWYMIETGPVSGVWRLEDLDGDGQALNLNETTVLLGPIFSTELSELTLSCDGELYLIDNSSPGGIYEFADNDGNGMIEGPELTSVYSAGGSTPALFALGDIAFQPQTGLGLGSYCAAKASSSGCLGTLSTTDFCVSPISGADDYSLFLNEVQANRPGIFFGSTNGQANLPFSGGSLCVQPPVKRSPIFFTFGTNGQCDGSAAVTINTGELFPQGFDAGPGGTSWYQAWYRDPLLMDPFGVALSEAFEIDWQ